MTDDLVARLRAVDRHDPACPFKAHCYCDDSASHDTASHPDAHEAAARIEALEAENRKLRKCLTDVQYEADREHGGLVHLKRAVSTAARAALTEPRHD